MRWLSRLATAQVGRAQTTAVPSASNFFDPARLIIVCALTLALIVAGSAALITYNLRHRALVENEQSLSNSALIIAKQIAQTYTTVEAVQKGFY